MSYDPISGTKLCNRCGERKATTEFYDRRSRAKSLDHWSYICRACDRLDKQRPERIERRRERDRTPEAVAQKRAYNATYIKLESTLLRNRTNSARWRAAKAASSGKYTASDVRRIWHQQRKRCAVCRCKIPLVSQKYHVDHIQPIVLGGTNLPSNIQLLCPLCNHRKGGRDPIDFMQRMMGRLL